jgi:NAD(P)-dependent dehydrogenase (short-subunit alcohol dehydrogenase family)
MAVLEGKVAIVTGGTSGIGARTVEFFVEKGGRVVVAGRRLVEGQALAAKLGTGGIIFGKGGGMPPAQADKGIDRLEDYFATIQPISRAGLPDDIAHAAVFLASDASSFVNGHDLVIDGGMGLGQDWEKYSAFRAEIGRRVSSASD